MKWKMLFRLGLTVVIVVAIILFYFNNLHHRDNRDKLSELVRSNNLVFQEALVRQGEQVDIIRNNVDAVLDNRADENDIKRVDAIVDGRIGAEKKGEGGFEEPIIKHEPARADSSVNKGKGDHSFRDPVKGDNSARKDNSANQPVKGDNSAEGHPDKGNLQDDGSKKNAEKEDSKSGVVSGLHPLHHRVGKEMNTQAHKIHLALVACGDRAEEVLVLLKSAVVLTPTTPLVLHIFAERELHPFFTQQLDSWPSEILGKLEYRVYDITYPSGENQAEWKKLFKPCASQRLFFPSLLDVDSLIYVDTDILFLSPLDKLWAFFPRFNASQLIALAPEHEDPNVGWYNRFARHPFVKPLGVNSGVMLMNLTRLRQSTWLPSMLEYYKEYRLKITWGDQDLINIYFHYHPDELYMYSCEWNYRPDHCMYMSVCKPAEEQGAFVLHGCRRVMHNDKHPAFKAVYNTFKMHHFWEDVQQDLLPRMKKNLQEVKATQCGKVAHIFLKQVEQFAGEAQGRRAEKQNRLKVPDSPAR